MNVLRRIRTNFDGFCKKSHLNSRYSTESKNSKEQARKTIHPYRNLHPWKSLEEFARYLIDNVIYNQDGLVAINKPLAISALRPIYTNTVAWKDSNNLPNTVSYTIEDALPILSNTFGYDNLVVSKSPEKYMSGVSLLVADKSIETDIETSIVRAFSRKKIPRIYWVVTTRNLKEVSGSKRVAMKLVKSPCRTMKKPIIIDSWGSNEERRQDVKVLSYEYKLISKSPSNHGFLVQLSTSTRHWHAVRLVAASELLSPILGDKVYSGLVQNVMGVPTVINTFLESAKKPEKLSNDLLQALHIPSGHQEIIPPHIHLRELHLMHFLRGKKDLILKAPLMPEFKWTCDQLGIKYDSEEERDEEDIPIESVG